MGNFMGVKAISEEMNKQNSILDGIEFSDKLSKRQVDIAKAYTIEKMKEKFTINGFCKDFNNSSKTWYEWIEITEFSSYLTALSNAIIPDDARMALKQLKKHLLKIPYKQNPTPKEIEMFMDVFSYVVEADKREQMEKLGLNKKLTDKVDNRTLEEKCNSLLQRLRN